MSDYNALTRNSPNETDRHPSSVPYAMAYVRTQEWETPFCAQEALANGTAFRSLVKPFTGKEGAR